MQLVKESIPARELQPPSFLGKYGEALCRDLIGNRWLPLVGAGLSAKAVSKAGKPLSLPLWPELGRALARELRSEIPSDPLSAITEYASVNSRPDLIARLIKLLKVGEACPGPAHVEFCSIPFDIVCTTNFDQLLEDQYRSLNRQIFPIIEEDQLPVAVDPGVTRLVKVHGDLNHPKRAIITLADYTRFAIDYALIATYLSCQFMSRTVVLIGYSFNDPDLQKLRQVLVDRLGEMNRPMYALIPAGTKEEIQRFEAAGVRTINLGGRADQRGLTLADAFRQLSAYVKASRESTGGGPASAKRTRSRVLTADRRPR